MTSPARGDGEAGCDCETCISIFFEPRPASISPRDWARAHAKNMRDYAEEKLAEYDEEAGK